MTLPMDWDAAPCPDRWQLQREVEQLNRAIKQEEEEEGQVFEDACEDVENRVKNYRPDGQDNLLAVVDDLEDDYDENDDDLRPGIQQVIDLTDEEDVKQAKAGPSPAIRNLPVAISLLDEQGYSFNELTIRRGDCIEIRLDGSSETSFRHMLRIQFVDVQDVFAKDDGGVHVRGLPLTRTRNLRGCLPRYLNEVCLVLDVDGDDDRDDSVQAAIDVPLTDVIRRRQFTYTNAPFPKIRFEKSLEDLNTLQKIEDHALLVCRWKYRRVFAETATRLKRGGQPAEFVFSHLLEEETARPRNRVEDKGRRAVWRGQMPVRGGSFPLPSLAQLSIPVEQEMEAQDKEYMHREPGQRYTFGDMFCGAGGASCGARMAGLKVRVAVDHHKLACESYRRNMEDDYTDLYPMDIYAFAKEKAARYRVDILHLSPPCQFWSPAHTVPGKNDEANIAVLFTCHELISKIRPRIFTLEQTYGILHPRFEHYFNALIHGFSQHGYSVRYKLVHLWHWGLPAKRLRLIMIGSCPGERLPTFPVHTHLPTEQRPAGADADADGPRPFVTVHETLSKIPFSMQDTDALHDVKDESLRYAEAREAWDDDVALQRTITCHGGIGNYHPNGLRKFTNREFATLQGFPVTYSFHKASAKKMIGNAFPPCAVKVLLRHIRRYLEQEDRVFARPEDEAEYDEVVPPNVVDLTHLDDGPGYTPDELVITGWRALTTSPLSVSSGSSSCADDDDDDDGDDDDDDGDDGDEDDKMENQCGAACHVGLNMCIDPKQNTESIVV